MFTLGKHCRKILESKILGQIFLKKGNQFQKNLVNLIQADVNLRKADDSLESISQVESRCLQPDFRICFR